MTEMAEAVRELEDLIVRLTARASAFLPGAEGAWETALRSSIEANYVLLDALADRQQPFDGATVP